MTWIHDRIFAAGGDHLPAIWESFADQTGITAVLHLRPGGPARFDGRPPAAFLWLGLEGEAQVQEADRWLAGRFVSDCLSQGRAVLIHSSLGRHRVRWAFVAYRLLCGAGLQTVLREAAQRPWLAPYRTDVAAWQAFAAAAGGRAG